MPLLICGLIVLTLLAGGCGPAISPGLLQQARPTLDFAQLQAQPETFQGRVVVLGGEIIYLERQGAKSVLLISQKPVDVRLRPLEKAPAGGQFLVESEQWLAPDAYVPQRKITVAGVVSGSRQGLLLLQARELYLWEHPFKLVPVPKDWYDPALEYWYTPPYFDPYRHTPH